MSNYSGENGENFMNKKIKETSKKAVNSGKFAQMEKQAAMAEQLMDNLRKVPICIYIG